MARQEAVLPTSKWYRSSQSRSRPAQARLNCAAGTTPVHRRFTSEAKVHWSRQVRFEAPRHDPIKFATVEHDSDKQVARMPRQVPYRATVEHDSDKQVTGERTTANGILKNSALVRTATSPTRVRAQKAPASHNYWQFPPTPWKDAQYPSALQESSIVKSKDTPGEMECSTQARR